jgi:hypothetical protein
MKVTWLVFCEFFCLSLVCRDQSPVWIYPWISIAFCSDNGYPGEKKSYKTTIKSFVVDFGQSSKVVFISNAVAILTIKDFTK